MHGGRGGDFDWRIPSGQFVVVVRVAIGFLGLGRWGWRKSGLSLPVLRGEC